jgi:sarcosine oxidase subunit beta
LGAKSKPSGAVIIGAGIVGCSIAFNLARHRCENVVVLERAEIGSGATARGRGGIRKQFSTASNIELSKRSFSILENFETLTGVSLNLRRDGYMFLATSDPQLKMLRENLSLQKSHGVDVRELAPGEVKEIVPEIETSDVLGANFCPTDGHVDNNLVLQAYVKAARDLGVTFREHTEVSGVRIDMEAVQSVKTREAEFSSDVVVIAAGAQSGEVASLGGLSIPINAQKRQVFVTEPVANTSRLPLVVDMGQGLGLASEGTGVLMGTDEPCSEPKNLNVEWESAPRVFEKAVRRMPLLANTRLRTAWAGYYEVTPDSNPVIGSVPGVEGLYCAAGFSGHGFMHAAAVGEILSDLIINGASSLDISPFRWGRFSEGAIPKEEFVV